MKIKEINAFTWYNIFAAIVIIAAAVTTILTNKERTANPTSYIADYCVVESAGSHFVAKDCKITATNIRKIP